MIDVQVSEDEITAVDVGKNEITVLIDDWEFSDQGPDLNREFDEKLTGSVGRLEFPEEAISVEKKSPPNLSIFDPQSDRMVLDEGHYVLKIEQSVIVYIAIEEACVLKKPTQGGKIRLDIQGKAPVTLGFRSRINRPRETITIPATIEGACAAIRWQAAGIVSESPDKSFPSLRVHPPAIELGDRLSIPESLRSDTEFSKIQLTVPRSLDELFTLAPLSYYLQGDIRLTNSHEVRLTAPTLDDPLPLGRSETLATDVAALLRRVFYLDCLVRNAGLDPVDLSQSELLDELNLDGELLYRQSTAQRLAAYLTADFPAISDSLPDWHLSTVVKPELPSLPAIPHLLNRLSLVQCPAPVSVDRQSLVAESVRDSYDSKARTGGSGSSYQLVRNRTRLGKAQGWMAPGTPVDGFRATQAAFDARSKYFENRSESKRILVVINDPTMLEESDEVEEIYRTRASDLAIDVSVENSLTCAELRNLFDSDVDFLHFIGHCDEQGLRCDDGWVAADSLSENQVQTFFLNACHSFEQGLELVRSGSVSGAVTIADVLNREATRVGMTFARLIMHGFSMSRALAIASRQSIRSKFYNVVGDGSHRLSQGVNAFPAELFVRRTTSDSFRLRFEFTQMNVAGGLAKPRVPPEASYVLRGSQTTADLARHELVDFLEGVHLPVIFEEEFHWSTELAERLRGKLSSEQTTL